MAESKITGNPEIPIGRKTTHVRFIFAYFSAGCKHLCMQGHGPWNWSQERVVD